MWQRFTERARRVVFFAQEEAVATRWNMVRPEHLLLGVIRENDNVAARILDRMGVSLQAVREDAQAQTPQGRDKIRPEMQLHPATRNIIELTAAEANLLSNKYIGTEHLLLAILREANSVAWQILVQHGADLERTRREVLSLQDNDTIRPAAPAPTPGGNPAASPMPAASESAAAPSASEAGAGEDAAAPSALLETESRPTPPLTPVSASTSLVFQHEYENMPPEQQELWRRDGLPYNELPQKLQGLLYDLTEGADTHSAQSRRVVLEPAGRVTLEQTPVASGTIFTLAVPVTLVTNLVLTD